MPQHPWTGAPSDEDVAELATMKKGYRIAPGSTGFGATIIQPASVTYPDRYPGRPDLGTREDVSIDASTAISVAWDTPTGASEEAIQAALDRHEARVAARPDKAPDIEFEDPFGGGDPGGDPPGGDLPGGDPPGGDPPGSTTTPGSLEVIRSTLQRWGFTTEEIGGLSGWVQSQLQAGIGVESVLILIYDQSEFQSRFPGMKAATDAGFAPPSPDQYIEYEDGLREHIDRYLPNEATGDLDALITTLMGGNISILQVRDRLQIAYDEILNAPVDVKSWFLQEYGQSADAMLATVLLDPDQSFTDLEQAAKESYTQAAASEILSNAITKDTARQIASLGYTQESQYRQFTDLARQEFLYLEKLTERDNLRIEREGVEASFGIDVGALRAVEEREEERLSEFSGGGGAYAGTGITGFGAINA